jgi:hypothetical protein
MGGFISQVLYPSIVRCSLGRGAGDAVPALACAQKRSGGEEKFFSHFPKSVSL